MINAMAPITSPATMAAMGNPGIIPPHRLMGLVVVVVAVTVTYMGDVYV